MDVLSPPNLFLCAPCSLGGERSWKRVVRAGAHARSTPGGPEQQARRDLDFFINRHEHDPLHKFVLRKKKKVNVKKNSSREEGIGEGPPKPLGPINKP